MRFTVFGIPVTVDLFFVIGLVMVWSWAGGNRAGLFAAILVGIFTLIHELGHAVTARRFGATSAITLNLLVGWASYSAPRPLTRRQRNIISLAGPLTQIVVALPLLIVTYLALPRHGSAAAAAILQTGRTTVAFDLWQGAVWAGIVIGLLNLLPLWPLDGGHVLDTVLTTRLGERRGRRAMLIGTLVAVGLIAGLGFSVSRISLPYSFLEREVVGARYATYSALYRSLPHTLWDQIRYFPGHVLDFPLLLLIFCGLNSFMTLQRTPRHDRVATWVDVETAPKGARVSAQSSVPDAAVLAERTGWQEGVLVPYPSGWGPSPWLQAHVALVAGRVDEARAALTSVSSPGRPRWLLPDPTEHPELARVVSLLPEQLVVADREHSLVLMQVLAVHGSAEQVAGYGVALYSATHDAEVLYLVAGGLARAGHGDEAMAWLRRAVQDKADHHRLATDRRLWALHGRADYQQLLAEARSGR